MQGDMRWIAQMADGRIVQEWGFEGSWIRGAWRETPFTLLPVSQIISFGMEGLGVRVGFYTHCGKLGINGKALELKLIADDGEILPITDYPLAYYEPYQYKQATFDVGHVARPIGAHRFALASTERGPRIEAYVVGWRMQAQDSRYGQVRAELEAAVWPSLLRQIPVRLRACIERGFVGQLACRFGDKPLVMAQTILRPGEWHETLIRIPRS